MVAAREVVRDLTATERRHRRGRRRAPARRRPELPLQALQRRVDAQQRPARRRPARRRASTSCSPTATTTRICPTSSSRGPPSGSATRSRRSSRTASASCPCPSGPRATTSPGSSARSARRACSTGRIRDPRVVERTVGEVMDPPLPIVEASASLDEAFALLQRRRSPGRDPRRSPGRRGRRSSTCSSTSRTTGATAPRILLRATPGRRTCCSSLRRITRGLPSPIRAIPPSAHR